MANARYGNTFYIDTQYSSAVDELAVTNIKVTGIILNSTAISSSHLLLTDGGNNKIDLRGNSLGGSIYFDLSNSPVVFSTTIRPTTLSNVTATLIVKETGA